MVTSHFLDVEQQLIHENFTNTYEPPVVKGTNKS